MIITLIIATIYVTLTVLTSIKISKSILLSGKQKVGNILVNALVPVIWFYLIYPIIFQENKIITRAEREKMIAEENGSKLGDEVGSSQNARLL